MPRVSDNALRAEAVNRGQGWSVRLFRNDRTPLAEFYGATRRDAVTIADSYARNNIGQRINPGDLQSEGQQRRAAAAAARDLLNNYRSTAAAMLDTGLPSGDRQYYEQQTAIYRAPLIDTYGCAVDETLPWPHLRIPEDLAANIARLATGWTGDETDEELGLTTATATPTAEDSWFFGD